MVNDQTQVRVKLKGLVASVLAIKQRQGFHIDNVGDIILSTKGKAKIKINVNELGFK